MGLRGVIVKNGDLLNLKSPSRTGVPSEHAHLRKSNPPSKSPEKLTLPPFTMHPIRTQLISFARNEALLRQEPCPREIAIAHRAKELVRGCPRHDFHVVVELLRDTVHPLLTHILSCQSFTDKHYGAGSDVLGCSREHGNNKPLQIVGQETENVKLGHVRRLFVTCDVFTRYFFVVFSCFFFLVALISLEKQCLRLFPWLFRGFFVAFSWPSFWAKFTRTRPRKVF